MQTILFNLVLFSLIGVKIDALKCYICGPGTGNPNCPYPFTTYGIQTCDVAPINGLTPICMVSN